MSRRPRSTRFTAEQKSKLDARLGQLRPRAQAGGHLIAAAALQPTTSATTISVRNGKTLTTDGPFAETKEQLGGFYLIEARDLNEAIQIAARIPVAQARQRSRCGRSMEHRGRAGATCDATRSTPIYRAESRRVLATLIRLLGDFDLAEEALHDAFVAAAEQWPREGVPGEPAGLAGLGRPVQGDRPAAPRGALRCGAASSPQRARGIGASRR